MITTKLEKSYKKITTPDNKLGTVGHQSIEFYHQANAGDTTINLTAMTLPASVAAKGFVNPSIATIAAAKLLANRANLSLHTYKGRWFDRIDYDMPTSVTIKLNQPAEQDEIFYGVIQNIVKNQTVNLDLQQIVAVGTLAQGATDFVVGKQFRVNQNPMYQMGELQVFRGNHLSLMLRNVDNAPASPSADGNYQEVDSGGGWGNKIKFNDVGLLGGELVVVMSTGRLLERPTDSLLQEIEALAGQLDAIIPYVEELMDMPAGSLKSSPTNVDLKSFGDKVLMLDSKYNTAQNISDYTKTKYQIKTGTGGDVTTVTGIPGLTFNNLEIGKKYRAVLRLRTVNTASVFAYTGAIMNGATSLLPISFMGNCNVGNTNTSNDEVTFVASASTLSVNYVGSGINANTVLCFMKLEELPNHELTTQWT